MRTWRRYSEDVPAKQNKAFIDIRLRPGIATPRGVLYFATISPCMLIRSTTAKRDVIHKTGITQRSKTPPEEDRSTATGDLRTKFRADRSSGCRDMLADRQTDRQADAQTYGLITILRTPTGWSNEVGPCFQKLEHEQYTYTVRQVRPNVYYVAFASDTRDVTVTVGLSPTNFYNDDINIITTILMTTEQPSLEFLTRLAML